MKYEKQKYYYRRKYVSIPLCLDEGTISDVIILVFCKGSENVYVYNHIRYYRKFILIDRICEYLTISKLTDEIIENKINELLENHPKLSSNDIVRLTGYNKERISRFYMVAKRKLL